MELSVEPYDVTPGGEYRSLVRVSFRDAADAPTTLLHGGDVEFDTSRGTVQWQTRFRFGSPSALVALTEAEPAVVTARLVDPPGAAPPQTVTIVPRVSAPRIVARALGPHLVNIGWFPRVTAGAVRITRRQSGGPTQRIIVTQPSSGYRDATVVPGRTYRYAVAMPGAAPEVRLPSLFATSVPPEPQHGTVGALRGKAMWFSFSPDPSDPDAAQRLDPQAIVAQATRAGVRCIVLRTAYGPFWEITPSIRPAIDDLIDTAAANGIALVGWTVPRSADFDNVARSVATTAYRTANGNGFGALAIDLERGGGYLGDGATGRATIVEFVHRLREAVGRDYPLIATVEDPSLEGLTEQTYPYAEIATSVDALQPMTYWRMLGAGTTTPQGVRAAFERSFSLTRALAGRSLPLVAGAQTSGVGNRGAPTAPELTASIEAARALGALGITFFDWTGTNDAQWDALGQTAWP